VGIGVAVGVNITVGVGVILGVDVGLEVPPFEPVPPAPDARGVGVGVGVIVGCAVGVTVGCGFLDPLIANAATIIIRIITIAAINIFISFFMKTPPIRT
jgi:hypothetical protein